MEMMYSNLIDELTRILHPIHRDPNSIEHSYSHHTISIVCIGEMYTWDERSEYATSSEDTPADEWNIGIRLHDKPRSEHDIEWLVSPERILKMSHICNIMLSIRIECDEIFPVVCFSILPDILESCLESRSGSTVGDMVYAVYLLWWYHSSQEGLCTIGRSIIDDEYLLISCRYDTLDHVHDTSSFVVRSDEEYDFIFLHWIERSRGWVSWPLLACSRPCGGGGEQNKTGK